MSGCANTVFSVQPECRTRAGLPRRMRCRARTHHFGFRSRTNRDTSVRPPNHQRVSASFSILRSAFCVLHSGSRSTHRSHLESNTPTAHISPFNSPRGEHCRPGETRTQNAERRIEKLALTRWSAATHEMPGTHSSFRIPKPHESRHEHASAYHQRVSASFSILRSAFCIRSRSSLETNTQHRTSAHRPRPRIPKTSLC